MSRKSAIEKYGLVFIHYYEKFYGPEPCYDVCSLDTAYYFFCRGKEHGNYVGPYS